MEMLPILEMFVSSRHCTKMVHYVSDHSLFVVKITTDFEVLQNFSRLSLAGVLNVLL